MLRFSVVAVLVLVVNGQAMTVKGNVKVELCDNPKQTHYLGDNQFVLQCADVRVSVPNCSKPALVRQPDGTVVVNCGV